MKNFKYIFVLLLAFLVFTFGAGTVVVHVCSVYCKTNVCHSSVSTCEKHSDKDCCHESDYDCDNAGYSFTEECSCLNFSYNIDFYKYSQDENPICKAQMVMDVLEIFSCCLLRTRTDFLSETAIDTPPLQWSSRKLLAMNSVLII